MGIRLLLALLALAIAVGLWDRSLRRAESDTLLSPEERFRRAQEKYNLTRSLESFAATNFSGSNGLSTVVAAGAGKINSIAQRERDQVLIAILREKAHEQMRNLTHVLAIYGASSDAVDARKILEGAKVMAAVRRIPTSSAPVIFRLLINPADLPNLKPETIAALETLHPLKPLNLESRHAIPTSTNAPIPASEISNPEF